VARGLVAERALAAGVGAGRKKNGFAPLLIPRSQSPSPCAALSGKQRLLSFASRALSGRNGPRILNMHRRVAVCPLGHRPPPMEQADSDRPRGRAARPAGASSGRFAARGAGTRGEGETRALAPRGGWVVGKKIGESGCLSASILISLPASPATRAAARALAGRLWFRQGAPGSAGRLGWGPRQRHRVGTEVCAAWRGAWSPREPLRPAWVRAAKNGSVLLPYSFPIPYSSSRHRERQGSFFLRPAPWPCGGVGRLGEGAVRGNAIGLRACAQPRRCTILIFPRSATGRVNVWLAQTGGHMPRS
jgi:hypothetical protein